jgi:hypothetical protein
MGGFCRLSGFDRRSSLDESEQRNKAISVIADGEGSCLTCIYALRTHTPSPRDIHGTGRWLDLTSQAMGLCRPDRSECG